MKKSIYTIFYILSLLFVACSQSFDNKRADEILLKSEISEAEYSELLKLYEIGMDDSLEIAKKGNPSISKSQREEMLTMFAIAKRLVVDRDKLTDSQVIEFDRITNKGKEGLEK